MPVYINGKDFGAAWDMWKNDFRAWRSKLCCWVVKKVTPYIYDGDAMHPDMPQGPLLQMLSRYVGETGQSEDALEAVTRIIVERNDVRRAYEQVPVQYLNDLFHAVVEEKREEEAKVRATYPSAWGHLGEDDSP